MCLILVLIIAVMAMELQCISITNGPATLVIAWMLSRDARKLKASMAENEELTQPGGTRSQPISMIKLKERTSEFGQLVSALIEEERIGHDELFHTLTRSRMADAEFGL